MNLTIISKNGASGDYPGCTDLAYNKAITDGVDFIDCPVQMSKDGIPFCSNSINLIDGTNAIQSQFSSYVINIPELMPTSGIFAFNLTWDEIKTLKRKFFSPMFFCVQCCHLCFSSSPCSNIPSFHCSININSIYTLQIVSEPQFRKCRKVTNIGRLCGPRQEC